MQRKLFYIMFFCILYLGLITGLSFAVDTTAPGKISTFTVTTDLQIKLNWTAPGNDGYTGDVTGGQWIIKYSTNSLATADTAENSVAITSNWICGSTQTTTLTALIPETTYYIWIKSCDDLGNWSVWSDTRTALAGIFADTLQNLPNVNANELTWGDYDNDGDLDLAVVIYVSYLNYKYEIYRNDNGMFTNINANLSGDYSGGLSWIDYDNDGDLDLIIGGSNTIKIYKNNGGVFNLDQNTGLSGITCFNFYWGDYNNDGLLDVILVLDNWRLKFYENKKGVFSEVNVGLPAFRSNDLVFCDYNNDGNQDLIISGCNDSASEQYTKCYKNNGVAFTLDTNMILPNIVGNICVGDYNNDGYIDVALSGDDTFSYYTEIYKNNGGISFSLNTTLDAVRGNMCWGDYDNDGDLDLALNGSLESWDTMTKIYRNDNGTFTENMAPGILQDYFYSLECGDYDNDGNLDIIALVGLDYPNCVIKFYKSYISKKQVNNVPNSPTTYPANYNSTTGKIELRWDKATDDKTPIEGLYYEVRVATQPITDNLKNWIVSVTTGGGVGYSSEKKLGNYPHGYVSSLSPGINLVPVTLNATYYWQVRAMDTSLSKSAWSDVKSVYAPDFGPGKISTFTATADTQVKLTWKAPGDNGYLGDVTSGQWLIKYSKNSSATPDTAESNITISSNWVCGSTQTLKMQGLDPETTYYFWIKARDGAGNWSDWSDKKIVKAGMFEEIGITGLSGISGARLSWGDYDNDGDLDLAVSCYIPFIYVTKIYRNDNGVFTDIGADLTGVSAGSLSWGDYDNDGDLDLAIAGWNDSSGNISKIYKNTNGVFTDIGAGLTGVSEGSLSWGDYDNDGDLDLVIAGSGISKIYRNDNGVFKEDTNVVLPEINQCSVSWGDYDNDGDLDLAIAGWNSSSGNISKIYKNTNGVFTDIEAGLTGVSDGSLSWGDYDNDGDLDLAVAGYNLGYISRIYRNDGNNTFTDINAGLTGVNYCSISWGDYDNDGDLDLAVIGTTGVESVSKIYRNNGLTFDDAGAGLTGASTGSLSWGDYDNDGDLDLVIAGRDGTNSVFKMYKSVMTKKQTNNVPNVPTVLPSGYNSGTGKLEFKWNKATDDKTKTEGLYYEIRVATQPITNNLKNWIVSVTTGSGTGYNNTQILGNYPHGYINSSLQAGMSFANPLSNTTYYWQVRAMDTGLRKSAWSIVSSVYVGAINTFQQTPVILITPSNNYSVNFTTITFDWDDLIYPGKTISNYELQISTDINFGIINYSSSPIVSSAVITSINPNKKYYWRVRAKNTLGSYSAYSLTRNFTIDTISPSSVIVNGVAGTGSGEINLNWNMTGDNGTSGTLQTGSEFAIQCSTWSGVLWSTSNAVIYSTAGINPGTLINYHVTGLEETKLYYFRVWYKDAAGNWSNGSVLISTTTSNGPPTVPVLSLPIDLLSTNSVDMDFSWQASTDSSGVANYELQISTNINFGSVKYSSSPVTSSSTVNSMDLNEIYYWRVRAVDILGAKSNWSSVRKLILGNAVYQFDVTKKELHKINLGWKTGVNSKYRIDFSTNNINWNLYKDNITGNTCEATRLKPSTTYYFSLKTYDSLSALNVSSSIISGITEILAPSLIVYANSNNTIKQKFTVNGKELEATIEIPEGAVSETSYMNFNFDPLNAPVELTDTSKIQQADNKLGKNLDRCGVMIEFNLYNMYGDRITSFSKPIKIIIPYLDQNNDGIIDGTNPALSETLLKIYFLDETKGEWVLAGGNGGIVDTKNNIITVETTHFSVYTLASSPSVANDLSKAIVYPNPYKPGTGGQFDRSDGVMFSNLTQKAKIKIYTIAGDFVTEINKDNMDNKILWNVTNDGGNKLTSGVYIYIITNPDKAKDKAKGKIGIIK
jgi:hypothetical protein